MNDFEGKVAVITGAASGIGFALAEIFAQQGMKIVLADIEAAALASAVAQIQGTGAEAIGVVTDVSSAESVQQLADKCLERFAAVHILCNNAGVISGGLSWEAPL